jgi:xylan 1,4-beta-xylosidase
VTTTDVVVDINASGHEVVPHWRVCVGGGRTAEALRAQFQRHLEMVQADMPFSYLRMHGIFHEDMMVYRGSPSGPVLNWQYVDMVYDHWLSVGVRPFVELGFMPYDLASGESTVFWWKGNITRPKDWARWSWLVSRFVEHVAERYGIDEVRRWYFEVWNEPNLEIFWQDADFGAYMELYERTARAIKAIDGALRVGGPASSGAGHQAGQAPWGRSFLAECRRRDLPVDFFSTHPYPTIHTVDLVGRGEMSWDGPDRLVTDLRGMADLLGDAGYGALERHCTEWSSSPSPRDPVHDTAFMAPFIVQNNWRARGLTESLAFWALSDIFEENRLGDGPFHGGFGLVNAQSLKKPAYHGYWALARLGSRELASGDDFAATLRDDGTVAVALWNYCHYRSGPSGAGEPPARPAGAPGTAAAGDAYEMFGPGHDRHFSVTVKGFSGPVELRATRFDREHGSVYDAWVAMGAPAHLLPSQLEDLKEVMEPEHRVRQLATNEDGSVTCPVTVAPHGVTLLELSSPGPGAAP